MDALDGDGLFGCEPHSQQGWHGDGDPGWLIVSHGLEKGLIFTTILLVSVPPKLTHHQHFVSVQSMF
jgi:hypothetical protein